MSRRLPWSLLLSACVGACAAPAAAPAWESSLAGALALRAEELAADGDPDQARELAAEALEAAIQARATAAEARSRLVLAQLDRDLDQARAARLLAAEPARRWPATLLEAELLLEAGRDDEALALLEPLVVEAAAWPELAERGAHEGRARHLAAVALRRLGRHDDATRHQRLALLALSLLADDQALPLRRAAAQGRGDDLARLGDWVAAHQQHARAASLAAALGDTPAELAALGSRVDDLAGMGRGRDAAHLSAQRARAALGTGEHASARQAAQRGLHWCDVFGVPDTDPLRPELLALLRELDRLDQAASADAEARADLPTTAPGQ